jgi:hypothetical protein
MPDTSEAARAAWIAACINAFAKLDPKMPVEDRAVLAASLWDKKVARSKSAGDEACARRLEQLRVLRATHGHPADTQPPAG